MISFKKLWTTRRRETLIGILVISLALISLAVNFGSIKKNANRMAKGTKSPREELLKSQKALLELIDKRRNMQKPISSLAKKRQCFWLPQDAKPQFELRRRIDRCARESGLKLKSVGTLQTTKIADGLFVYEISISADGQLPELLSMIQKIESESPRLYWKNLTINPDNIREPNFLMLNGTIKMVHLEQPEMIHRLWGQ